MADLKYLHNEALRLRQRAHEKINEAYQATVRALTFNKASDYDRAAEVSLTANSYYNEAIQLENAAMNIDHQVAELEQRALDLERQTSELQTSIKSKLEMLEKLKRTIVGY